MNKFIISGELENLLYTLYMKFILKAVVTDRQTKNVFFFVNFVVLPWIGTSLYYYLVKLQSGPIHSFWSLPIAGALLPCILSLFTTQPNIS